MGEVLSGHSTLTGCQRRTECGQQAFAHQGQQQNGDGEQDVQVASVTLMLIFRAPVTTGAPVNEKSQLLKSRNRAHDGGGVQG
ncbi:MAG: hypothetical protein ACRESV_07080, partial [Nevskiales bacterium]